MSESVDRQAREPVSQAGEPGKKPESLRVKVSKAMFWNTVLFPVKFLIRMLASLVTVNGLRVTGYGIYGSLVAANSTISLYTDLGLERTLPKFLPEVEHRFGRAGVRLFLQLLLGAKLVILTAVFVVLQVWSPFFVSYFQLPAENSWIITALCALIFFGALSNIMVQILYAFFKQRATNLLDILTAVLQPLLTAVLVLLGYGVAGAVASLLVTTVIILALQTWQARRVGGELAPSPRPVRLRDVLSLLPRIAPYALLIYLFNISSTLYDYAVPLLVLTGMGNVAAAATLKLAGDFTMEPLRFLVAPQQGMQVPLFSRIFVRGDRELLQRAYASLTRLFILALFPSAVGLILVGRGLFQLLYRAEFGGAAPVMVVIVVGAFLHAMLGSVPENILQAYERYWPVVVARLLVLGTIPLLLWLAGAYGAMGAALSMSTARLASTAVVLGAAVAMFRLRFPWRFLGRVTLATVVMVAVLLPILWAGGWGLFDALPPAGWGERITGLLILVGVVLLGVAVFLVTFRRLGGLEQEDRERVAELRFPLKGWILRWL